MLKHFIAVAGILGVMTSAAMAGPSCCKPAAKSGNVKKTKVAGQIEVRVCPVTEEEVSGEGAGSSVIGKYKVYFCCAGCKPAFDKLSPAEKLKKAQAALKVQQKKAA